MTGWRRAAASAAAAALLVFAVATSTWSTAAAQASAAEAKPIIELTDDNFDQLLDEHRVLLVEFFAPWCSHCKVLDPEIQTAAQLAAELNLSVRFGKVDATKEEELTKRFKVERTPTFIVFKQAMPDAFPVLSSGAAIISHLQQTVYLLPPENSISPTKVLKNYEETIKWLFWRGNDGGRLSTALVLFTPTLADATEAERVFTSVARKMVGKLRFGQIVDDEVITKFALPEAVSSVVLYTDFDEGKQIYSGALDASAIEQWVNVYTTPLVLFVDHLNMKTVHAGRAKLLVHMFVEAKFAEEGPARTYYMQELSALAKALLDGGVVQRGDVTIAISDGEQYSSWMRRFKLPTNKLPAIGAYTTATMRFFPCNEQVWREVVHPPPAEDIPSIIRVGNTELPTRVPDTQAAAAWIQRMYEQYTTSRP